MLQITLIVFSSILLMPCTHGDSPFPTTSKTILEYYTSDVDWNVANAHCKAEGGRLIQFDEESESGRYSRQILTHTCEKFSGNHFTAWLGLTIREKNKDDFVWTDCCEGADSDNWLHNMPDSLDTNFCVYTHALCYAHGNWEHNLLENGRCDSSHGFICEYNQGVPCDYTVNNNKTLLVPNADAETDLFNGVTETDCQEFCNRRIKSDNECWGFNYRSVSSQCELIYTAGPFDMDNKLDFNPGAISKSKRCFEIDIKTDIISSTVVPSLVPITPCFGNLGMTDCHEPTSKGDYSSTTSTVLLPTSSVSGQAKSSPSKTSLLLSWTTETTTATTTATTTSLDKNYIGHLSTSLSTDSILTGLSTEMSATETSTKQVPTLTTDSSRLSESSLSKTRATTTTATPFDNSLGTSENISPALITDLMALSGTTWPLPEATITTVLANDCV